MGIDKCLARTPNMNIGILDSVYEVVSESRFVYRAEVWRIEVGWGEADKSRRVVGSSCVNVL